MQSYERCMAEAERCREAGIVATEHADQLGAIRGECDWLAEAEYYRELKPYGDFLKSKSVLAESAGFNTHKNKLNPMLFDWQRHVVRWALGKGKAALFEGCGLGKTAQQIEWGYQVHRKTAGEVLILAPLMVAEQTADEGRKFGRQVTLCRSSADLKTGINVTNYEMLEHFNPSGFSGVILDESSILKSADGSTRKLITESFVDTPYKLSCTATPSPNDYMELGTQAEFLGVMTRSEMLATFFVHDGGDTSQWRLKGHAVSQFWKWVCSWAVMIQKPSDIGFSDDGYVLPPMRRHQHTVKMDRQIEGCLFTPTRLTLTERRDVRRASLSSRVAKCAEIVNASDEQFLIWCDLNDESTALAAAIDGAVEVTGSHSREFKVQAAKDFIAGKIKRLVSKGSIFGWGLNFQHCWNQCAVGLSDSFEMLYQIERRCWRFGQTHEVNMHVIVSDGDGPVVANIERKERDFELMQSGMLEHMRDEMKRELGSTVRAESMYRQDSTSGNGWTAVLGDSTEWLYQLPPESIDFSVFSPPFASLYTYSNSERDLGNSKTYEQFSEHYRFILRQLFRVLSSGRLVSIHCMNLPTSKERDGYIGIRDFRGDIIRAMQAEGFIYHSEVVIWKDPVTAMQRTKALGLLYKQLRKDSAMSRQGIPDYLVTFRKPGENINRVTKTHEGFSVDLWQNFASPVWMDINPSDTLQKESAREENDERHICPLQLQVIERAIRLWTNPGDLVLSPFMGIGSEGYVAIRNDRRFVGCELKESYYKQAVANLSAAETAGKDQGNLFEGEDVAINR